MDLHSAFKREAKPDNPDNGQDSVKDKTKTETNEFYTGEKSKVLYVHVMQDNVEVDKPIKTVIWKQEIEWRQRVFPISPQDFIVDNKGVNHQYVDANKMRAKRFSKSPDTCIKCGGRLSSDIDARNARDLLKRKTIEPIWGIDSTHIILMLVMGIIILGVMGFAFYQTMEVQKMQSKINTAVATGDTSLLVDKKPSSPSTSTTKNGNTVTQN